MNPNQESPEPDAMIYRRLFADLWREHYILRAKHDALMQVLMQELPLMEGDRLTQKIDALAKEYWTQAIEKLEDLSPSLSAELDKHRPLQPPDGKA